MAVCAEAGRRTGTAVVEVTGSISQAGERDVSVRLLSSLHMGLKQLRAQQWPSVPGAAPKTDNPNNCTGASVACQSFTEIPGGSCVDF